MNKSLITAFLITCIFSFGCSKVNKSDIGASVVKIELVSDGGQTDTIGNALKNPIIIKVTWNNVGFSGYSVQFKGSGCNQDNIVSAITQQFGMASYSWTLAGDAGQQTLTAYVLNSDSQKVDSVKINATAVTGGAGWHNGGCSLQAGLTPANLCKLSTGRLFTCFAGGKTYLRYSDNNGVNWYAVGSLGNSHQINYVISDSSDELFAFATDGIFYSKDAGKNWSNVSTAPFDTGSITGAVVTPSGKILVTTSSLPPLNISVDKGKTWTTIANSAFPQTDVVEPFFNCPAEDKDGTLYVTDTYNGHLFTSTDGGTTWYLIADYDGINNYASLDYSFFIDANNSFYKSQTGRNAGIFISDDKGVGYSGFMIAKTQFAKYGNMSFQSDGHFYFEEYSNGLYVFDGYNVGTLIFAFNGTGLQPYIVAKNNNMIVANWGKPYIKYYSK